MQYLLPVVVIAVVVIAIPTIFLLVFRRFIRCRSNRLLVVVGKTGAHVGAKVIHGGATFVWPVIQRHFFLSLDPMHAAVTLPSRVSPGDLERDVPNSFTFAIGTDEELMLNAAIRLVTLPVEEIEELAGEIIRTELARLVDASEGQSDGKAFHDALGTAIDEKLKSLGLQLINIGYQ